MLIQSIDYFLVAWFLLAAASACYVGVDQYLNNPEPAVMRWGFILVSFCPGTHAGDDQAFSTSRRRA